MSVWSVQPDGCWMHLYRLAGRCTGLIAFRVGDVVPLARFSEVRKDDVDCDH